MAEAIPEKAPDTPPEPEGPQPIEFHAILTPEGEWQIKCVLLGNPALRYVMRGFMDELHDTVKILLAQQAAGERPRIQPAKGGFFNGLRNRLR